MSVNRKLIDVVAELAVIAAELISVIHIQVLYRFAVIATAQRSPALTGTTGDHHREALIVSARPQHRLSQSRHAQDGDALRVHALIGLEVIHRPAQAPGPGS